MPRFASFVARSSAALRRLVDPSKRIFVAGLLLLVAVACGVAYARTVDEAEFVDDPEYGDTTTVWGPYTYTTTGWHVENVQFTLQPGRQYLMRVVNGEPDGTLRATDAKIKANLSYVISPEEFAVSSGGWIKPFLPSDTTEINTVINTSGAKVTVSVIETADPTVVTYTERFYAPVDTGRYKYRRPLTFPAGVGAPYFGCAVNGNANGTSRVKEAYVTDLTGTQILADLYTENNQRAMRFYVNPVANDSIKIAYNYATSAGFIDICLGGRDAAAPTLTISSPTTTLVTHDTLVTVAGTMYDSTATVVRVNGTVATLGSGDSWSADVSLVEGVNTLAIVATDAAGNHTDSSRTVRLDRAAPVVMITTPASDAYTLDTLITLSGTATDASSFTLNVNGASITPDSLGNWTTVVAAPNEANVFVVTATDAAGNAGSAVRIMGRDVTAPTVTVTAPVNNDTTDASSVTVTGTVVDSTSVTLTVNGDTVPLTSGAFSRTVNLLVGSNTVLVIARDVFGNVTTVSRAVFRSTPGSTLPPDPSTVASALDATVATNTYASMQFLWTGTNPIQTDVLTGAISPKQVVVLRGKVLTASASALTDATIRVVNNPGLGQTRSRADGQFDIAVNGGGLVTLEVSKSGYLPVQRTINAPWQQWVTMDSLVLTALDTVVTTIDFSDTIEVARASVTTDSAGSRQPTLMFKQGTTVQLVMPNGSLQSISSISVRVTEFTKGPLGLAAMPAPLPPTTAFTYAAEFSTDEAIAAGAREVVFSQPVSFYLDNFLSFPVGSILPVGYYDRDRAMWRPEPDGRVISIVSVTGGLADLAVTSAGTAASQALLDSLGFSNAERAQLATLYSVGKALWRTQQTHFSSQDVNTSITPPDHAAGPNTDPTRSGNKFDCGTCTDSGSVIGLQNQTLGEQLGIAGTAFALDYSSDRAFGARSQRRVTIPAQERVDTAQMTTSGNFILRNRAPSHVASATYRLQVAGREIRQGPVTGSSAFPEVILEWDGNDAAGRRMLGEQIARVSVEYRYVDKYAVQPATGGAVGRSFGGGVSTGYATAGPVRRTIPLVQSWNQSLGNFDAQSQGFGGWTLSAHHAYNPVTGVLYQGDGSRREAAGMGQTVRPLYNGNADDIAIAKDGSFYTVLSGSHAVWQYTAGGTFIRTVAGTGGQGYSGEGLRADSSRLNVPYGIALGPDGLVYIADRQNHRIRRVDADGRLRTIAGTGVAASNGNDGPALSAGIYLPEKLAFLPDGSLLFTEGGQSTVRRIGPDGIVRRFAGTGTYGETGNGGPATSATLSANPQIATGADGSVYIFSYALQFVFQQTRSNYIRRVRPDGIIERFVGGTAASDSGTAAQKHFLFGVGDLTVAPSGELWFSTGDKIRVVTPAGGIRVFAGSIGRCVGGVFCDPVQRMTGGLATQFRFNDVDELAVAPDGTVLSVDRGDSRVRAINPAMPGFDENDIVVASEDGGVVYQFNQYGRHLRTMDAMTRDTVLSFGYNGGGLLTSVTDANGDVTTITRNGSGVATAIVAADGQTTTLGYDANGFLSTVTNPKGERVALTTASNGLLGSMTDPRGGVFAFRYDSLGLLVSDSSAAGHVQTLARAETDTSSVVTHADELGRTTTYRLDRLGPGWQKRTVTNPAGLITLSTSFANDSTVTTSPDGTTMTVVNRGDVRFGAQAPVLQYARTQLPSGLTSVVTASRTTVLSNDADPLSLTSLLDTVRVNSRVYRSLYTRSTRTSVTTSPMGRTTTTVYDTAGRVVSSTVPGIQAATYEYDSRGRLSQAQSGGRSSTFAYDAQGRLLSTTDPIGRKDSLFYDDADRLTRRVLPDGRQITFAYDSAGNLTSVTPPGKPAHTFTYAPADRLASYNPPTNGLATSATGYAYNTAGQVTVLRRATGDSLRFTYDGAGRPASVVFDRGTIGFTFNSTTGNLTSLSAPGSLGLAFTYDGSLPTSVTWSGAVSGSTAVTYNSDFRVTSQTVNGSNAVSYGYDQDGLLTQAGALGLRRATNNGRLDADSLIIGGATQRTGYGYDAHGALSALTARRGTDTLFATSYVRDSLSRITQLTERVNGSTQVVGFTYDSVGRLATVTRNSTLTASYTYDQNGNRATKVTSGGTATATVDDQDRLTSYGGTTYAYTAHGDLSRKIVGTDTTFYTYDALGNLTAVRLPDGTDIGYLIDAQNRRIGQTVNDTLVKAWLYQGQLTPVAELDGSGTVVSRFVYATGVNVPDLIVRGDSTYRVIRDHLGSVRLVVNVASGTVAQRIAYDEFGIETENTNPGWQPFGYAGGLTDSQAGLVRFGARDYDPAAGRWTAKDPIGFAGGATSVYEYAKSDPINFVDATGRYALDLAWWYYRHQTRNRFNGEVPFTKEAALAEGWELQPDWKSQYHKFGYGNDGNTKYLLDNGRREAIYDKCGKLVTDPRNRGSYNYANGSVDHFVQDVLPWYLFGNGAGDSTNLLDRVIPPLTRFRPIPGGITNSLASR